MDSRKSLVLVIFLLSIVPNVFPGNPFGFLGNIKDDITGTLGLGNDNANTNNMNQAPTTTTEPTMDLTTRRARKRKTTAAPDLQDQNLQDSEQESTSPPQIFSLFKNVGKEVDPLGLTGDVASATQLLNPFSNQDTQNSEPETVTSTSTTSAPPILSLFDSLGLIGNVVNDGSQDPEVTTSPPIFSLFKTINKGIDAVQDTKNSIIYAVVPTPPPNGSDSLFGTLVNAPFAVIQGGNQLVDRSIDTIENGTATVENYASGAASAVGQGIQTAEEIGKTVWTVSSFFAQLIQKIMSFLNSMQGNQ